MSDFFYAALLILVVIALFNVMIFVHELGHFLAARWRGLKIDRFQIWFGKPIWKKEINGVQYGLGWIPAGGFVALPQMAAMESVEGQNIGGEELPPISPLDKIIVAFAGPLFSLLLAVAAAFVVWGTGKPLDAIKTNVVGGVAAGEPADGVLFPGDKILKIDGEPVQWFRGRIFDDISTKIMLTKGDHVDFEVQRDGKIITVTTDFKIAETKWYHRRALPRVGISPGGDVVVGELVKGEGKSPAERAELKVGDKIVSINGQKIYGFGQFTRMVQESDEKPLEFGVERKGEKLTLSVKPLKPLGEGSKKAMVGIVPDASKMISTEILHPNPWEQVRDSVRTMWMTIKTVTSPSSHVGVDQLAGPIGIAKTKFLLLQQPNGWLRVLAFFVLFNINLAILNMLPLPVLDGGHIVMASLEWLRGKPLPSRFLESLQAGFALLLMGFMLYITTKDIGDEIRDEPKVQKLVWPEGAGGPTG